MDSSATHQRSLLIALNNTSGPVLELGSGWYSTPLLHETCKQQNRMLYTVDHNQEWLSQFADMESPLHRLECVGWWGELILHERKYGLVFIDHAPACRREDEIRRLISLSDVFVTHDWEEKPAYGYGRIAKMFKFCTVDARHPAQTAILSNKVDVSLWLN